MLDGELVVRTRMSGAAPIYELVPYEKMTGDFPTHFVEHYVHWLNVETGDIEFRPISHPWTITSHNWNVVYSQSSTSLMRLGQERMLDIRSHASSIIGSIFSPLENPGNIDVSFGPRNGKILVSVRLPRLKLEFFLNVNDQLECRQFRGAIVDRDQSVGTMCGIVNRLVLSQGTTRSILIPYGQVKYQSHGDHVRVHIDTDGLQEIRYHRYDIDTKLGRLIGNGSLASHLYKIYLHAVTSHCLPDPLTSRTGTEEALDNLQSATTWSFQKLQPDEVHILKLIASLTPTRVYYPDNLRVMQSVDWKPISPIMQHDNFHAIVVEIFAHATRFHVFREDTGVKDAEIATYYKSKSDARLLERAAVRNAAFRKYEFGGSLLATSKDAHYIGRDSIRDEFKENQVYTVAKAVGSWYPNVDIPQNLMEILEGWSNLGVHNRKVVRLGYDHQWINPDLAGMWDTVYDVCRQSEKSSSTYQLMFFLSTLAYSGRVDLPVIGSLLAFATIPEFHSCESPKYQSYKLANKYSPNKTELEAAVDGCSVSFERSREANLQIKTGESESELWCRRNTTYMTNLSLQSGEFVANLISQWPSASPTIPCDPDYRLLNSSEAMGKVKPMFDSWYRNKVFRKHIRKVQMILDSVHPVASIPRTYCFSPCNFNAHSTVSAVRFKDLFSRNAPNIPDPPAEVISVTVPCSPERERAPSVDGSDLRIILDNLKKTHSRISEKQYADNMLASLEALEVQTLVVETPIRIPPASTLESSLIQSRDDMEAVFRTIQSILAPLRGVEDLISMAGLWPCISPISLLQQLPANASIKLNAPWKRALVYYGKSIAKLQRFERLLSYKRLGRESDFQSEAGNIGHQGWDQVENPDWLLIEIENNFLVRPVQNRIASKMIKPTSEGNQVLTTQNRCEGYY